MPSVDTLGHHLTAIPDVHVARDVPLNTYTRFAIGGPALYYVATSREESFVRALCAVRSSGVPWVVVGNGTNLIVSDDGFQGVVLRYTNATIARESNRVSASAGTELQDLVDFTIDQGLAGIHVMTGIPGSVGAAVYGNAGAYGRSISQSVREVRFFDGEQIELFANVACEFGYRESVFKHNKNRVILNAVLELEPGDAVELRGKADGIFDIRARKYPNTMKCAGSIFKNLLLRELPASVRNLVPEKVVIEGKVPSAWFLEQVGAKGMSDGDIRVAAYHANLIYNEGHGTAAQLRRLIGELKRRVADRFGFALEEEVQYIGF